MDIIPATSERLRGSGGDTQPTGVLERDRPVRRTDRDDAVHRRRGLDEAGARARSLWPAVAGDHRRLVGEAIGAHGGEVERTSGDSFFALFADPDRAVRAAIDAQRALTAHAWPGRVGELRVRMGVHTGRMEALRRRAHRPRHPSAPASRRPPTAGSGPHRGDPRRAPRGARHRRPGRDRLKDFPSPERLFLLVHDGRGPDAFPPLSTAPVRPTNLQIDPRPLIGRERELDELWDLLSEHDRPAHRGARRGRDGVCPARRCGRRDRARHDRGRPLRRDG